MDVRDSNSIVPAGPEDLGGVLGLLKECCLPEDGLSDHLGTCMVIHDEDKIAGSVALEVYGEYALLRSLAVREEDRGSGLGKALASAALDAARERQIGDVYLLTETAPEFFKRMGFVMIGREAVPEAVRGSVEFTTACPESAQAMHLRLDA